VINHVDEPFALIDAHISSIKAACQEAWRGPVVESYAAGSVVWMWDHYNTAVVLGMGHRRGSGDTDTWEIETWDADGERMVFEYEPSHLRPAVEPVQFRWASKE
jgi:hypothetical protein